MIIFCDAARQMEGDYRGASGWAALCYRNRTQAQRRHQRPYRTLGAYGFVRSSMEAELLALILPLKLRRLDYNEPITLVTDCQSFIHPWESYLNTRDVKASSPKGINELWAEFCNRAVTLVDNGVSFKLEWEKGHQGVAGPRRLVNIQARKLMRVQMSKVDIETGLRVS